MSYLQVIEYPEKKEWQKLLARPVIQSDLLDESVREILHRVKAGGDKILLEYAAQFDKYNSSEIEVTTEELSKAGQQLNEKLKSAIHQAKNNIESFHSHQLIADPIIEIQPGIRCWRRSVPIEKIGFYIPGGSAPLFSTLLMLAIPANIAGCKEIIVCTPAQSDGKIHAAVLYCAKLTGIKRIFKVGGAQAIAAMAYGTETIPAVYKIFGPGNQYVTHAKKMVQQNGIAIDMPAGPSELAVYADETAIPEFVAADLLSQSEHGVDSQVILVTNKHSIAEKVNAALKIQIENLPRKSVAEKSLAVGKIIIVHNATEALEILNEYAPEHLILACRDADLTASFVRSAGSVFIGNFSPESAGDYASGTNHTLPTNGYAKSYSGVSVDSFLKKISFQHLTARGLKLISQSVTEMARAEGLEAHASAMDIRFLQTDPV